MRGSVVDCIQVNIDFFRVSVWDAVTYETDWTKYHLSSDIRNFFRSLPTPGRFFFQKIDFFHFFIFCSTSYYKKNNAF